MNQEIRYVCGFAFDESLEHVALILKRKGPSFNVGLWNGLGGKMKNGEGIRTAMAREFKEECGVLTTAEQWDCFHQEKHLARAEQLLDPRIYFLTAKLPWTQFSLIRTTEDERVDVFKVYTLEPNRALNLSPRFVYSMGYLIEMAMVWHTRPQHRWIEG